MKLKTLFIAGITIAVMSCQKSKEDNSSSNTNPLTEQFVKVKFSGDLTTAESPLGRKVNNDFFASKTFADSTVYAISVNQDGKPIYNGLYSLTDSVVLKIPTSGNINVNAIAFRKGTGPGIYCYQAGTDFRYPWLGPISYNKMDSVYGSLYYNIDSIYNINLFNDEGTNVNGDPTRNSEIDTYVGRTSFSATQVPGEVNLSMRRIVFGIRYNVTNFNSGRLIADFSNIMPTKYFSPNGNISKQFVYTANDLQWADSLYIHPVDMTLKWEKADGNIVLLGQKKIAFKRNVLTSINVAIPDQSTGVPSMPIDSNWQKVDSVTFVQ